MVRSDLAIVALTERNRRTASCNNHAFVIRARESDIGETHAVVQDKTDYCKLERAKLKHSGAPVQIAQYEWHALDYPPAVLSLGASVHRQESGSWFLHDYLSVQMYFTKHSDQVLGVTYLSAL